MPRSSPEATNTHTVQRNKQCAHTPWHTAARENMGHTRMLVQAWIKMQLRPRGLRHHRPTTGKTMHEQLSEAAEESRTKHVPSPKPLQRRATLPAVAALVACEMHGGLSPSGNPRSQECLWPNDGASAAAAHAVLPMQQAHVRHVHHAIDAQRGHTHAHAHAWARLQFPQPCTS